MKIKLIFMEEKNYFDDIFENEYPKMLFFENFQKDKHPENMFFLKFLKKLKC